MFFVSGWFSVIEIVSAERFMKCIDEKAEINSVASMAIYLVIMYHKSYMQYLILWTLLNSISIARYNSMATYTVEVRGPNRTR